MALEFGRGFSEVENEIGGDDAVVLSHRL